MTNVTAHDGYRQQEIERRGGEVTSASTLGLAAATTAAAELPGTRL